MSEDGLHFLVPGRLDQITGGYLYDRRVVEGLRRRGRRVAVHELEGDFAREGDAAARCAAARAFAAIPDGAAAAVDGLALPAIDAAALREARERLRLVAFVHHPLALETGLAPDEAVRLAALERGLLPLFRGAICPSARTAAACIAYGLPAERVAIVPPGTEVPRVVVPRRPPPHGGEWRLLCVATLTPRKGHVVLVRALAEIAELPWRLVCIGSLERDPAAVAAVRREIAAHGLDRRVVLAGERPPERLGAAYAEADLFVLPSFHEGFGMAYAEAMAHGLPVIGTTTGAIPETVPSDAGLLVPPGDPAALAKAIRRLLLAEPELYEALAAGARRAGAAMPDWDATVRAWSQAFDRLVDRRAG